MTETERAHYTNGLQCVNCKFYRELPSPELRADFGYCLNEDSQHWYHVIFEHHTCEHFEDLVDRVDKVEKVD